jgi:hypothetical protein
VIAYKFLASGAVSPFSGFRWPAAGTWVEPRSPHEAAWIHACRPDDLAWWLDEELWRVELEQPVREGRYQVVAPRARLVSRIERWEPRTWRAFTRACALHGRDAVLSQLPPALRDALKNEEDLEAMARRAREFGAASTLAALLADTAEYARQGLPALTSYVQSVLVMRLGGGVAAFEGERGWQARWIAERLGVVAA